MRVPHDVDQADRGVRGHDRYIQTRGGQFPHEVQSTALPARVLDREAAFVVAAVALPTTN